VTHPVGSLFLLYFPLVAGLMVAASVFVAAFSRHRAAPWLAAVLAVAALWLVLASGELASEDPDVKFRWFQARFVVSVFQGPLFLFVVAEMVGARRLSRPWSVAAWLLPSFLTIPLVLTFRQHELLRRELTLDHWRGFSFWAGHPGSAALVVTGVSYCAGALCCALLVRAALRRPGLQRREHLLLLGTYLFPLAFDAAFRLGVEPLPRFNLLPFAQVPAFAVLVWMMARYRTFDVLTEMHAVLVDRIRSLVFVVDDAGLILEANEAAGSALALAPQALRGRGAALLPLFSAPPEAVTLGAGPGQRWFRRTTTLLRDRMGRERGTLWVFDDVTLERAREEEARATERLREERRHARQLELLVRDIHDGVGGATATIALLAALGRQDQPAAKDEALRRIQHVAQEGSADVRSLLNSLEGRGASWSALLVDFRSHAVALLERNGMEFSFQLEGTPPAEPPPLFARISLFRLFKEALTNVVKHARATRVEVSLAFAPGALALAVTDNGLGLPVDGPLEPGRGVRNMRSRAQELGGTLALRPARPSGLELRLDLKLPLPSPLEGP